MDKFSSGFIAQISYLEEKKCKNLEKFPLGAFCGNFGFFFGLWDIFKFLYFFIFYLLKKKLFEKKSEEKTNSCVNYGQLCVFYF
jgi:hypothetical protein